MAKRADEVYAELFSEEQQEEKGREKVELCSKEQQEAKGREKQDIARRIFQELVQLGEGTEDTRRRVTKQELLKLHPSESLLEEVIQQLADARLIVTTEIVEEKGQGTVERVAMVEVVHEALIRHWPMLREWIDADLEFLMWRERLRKAMERWEGCNQNEGALLRGTL